MLITTGIPSQGARESSEGVSKTAPREQKKKALHSASLVYLVQIKNGKQTQSLLAVRWVLTAYTKYKVMIQFQPNLISIHWCYLKTQ